MLNSTVKHRNISKQGMFRKLTFCVVFIYMLDIEMSSITNKYLIQHQLVTTRKFYNEHCSATNTK